MNTLEARFRLRIRVHPNGCWEWLGCKDKDGYGRVKLFGKNRQVHIVIWELLVGPLTPGMSLDHLKDGRGPCKMRSCCNPEHMEEVSRSENSRRVHLDRQYRASITA